MQLATELVETVQDSFKLAHSPDTHLRGRNTPAHWSPADKMADSNSSGTPAPTPAPTLKSKPVSEALLNEKWDRAISSFVIRSGLGFSFGVIFSVLLFKRRMWPVWLGTGFGAGRAWEEADANFKRGDSITDGLRKVRTER